MAQHRTGRPPDQDAGRRLLEAALRLVRAEGYRAVSISAIIREAGVSRQTLYNRWTTKAELVLEAFLGMAEAEVPDPDPTAAGGYEGALATFLEQVFDHIGRDGDTLRSLIAQAQEDPAFRESFRQRFVLPREEVVTRLLLEAQRNGALPTGRDLAMLSSFAHGAFWYRMLTGLPLGPDEARVIAAAIFAR